LTQFGKLPLPLFQIAAGIILLAATTSLAGCGGSDIAAAEDAASAQNLLGQNRIAEARLAIKKAIEQRDDEPQYHLVRGRIEMAAGSLSSAFNAYSDAMSLDPTNMEALQAVSQLGLQTGNFRESIEATDAILSLTPDEPGALLVRGLHAVIRKRFAEADGIADRILARDPNDEGGVILKARIAVRKGAPQEALQVLSGFGVTKTNTSGVVMTRLEVYRVMRDAAGMRSQFALLRNLASGDPDLRLDEANFAFKDGRARDGSGLIVAALADPKASAERIAQSLALWREYGDVGPADAALAPIASTGSVTARLATAEFLAERSRLAAARQLLTGLNGGQRTALDALIAAREGRWSEARRLADQVIAADDTHCLALTVRAETALQQGAVADAQRAAQVAASQCSGQTRAWILAADAYTRREDMENARRMWRQGIAANSQDAELARAYIDWLARAGQEREALSVARRLTHAAPALLSGWRLYRDSCQRFDPSCRQAAEAGLADAATLYAIDFAPGQAAPNGLFGRIVMR
jgi:tetratricopeptide (TPR) repeat protein